MQHRIVSVYIVFRGEYGCQLYVQLCKIPVHIFVHKLLWFDGKQNTCTWFHVVYFRHFLISWRAKHVI